jgi:hypothetical protein
MLLSVSEFLEFVWEYYRPPDVGSGGLFSSLSVPFRTVLEAKSEKMTFCRS